MCWHFSLINFSLSFLISFLTLAFCTAYRVLSNSVLVPFALNWLRFSTSSSVSLEIHLFWVLLFFGKMLLATRRMVSLPSCHISFGDFSSSSSKRGSNELDILTLYSLAKDV